MNSDIRSQFPLLSEKVHDKQVVFLDNASTTPKPQSVIDAVNDYYTHYCSNIHRSVYSFGEKASKAYEDSREVARSFFSAPDDMTVLFTAGATDGLNFVARGLIPSLSEGDTILLSPIDHHANLVPWQIAAEKSGANIKYIPITEDSTFDMAALDDSFFEGVKVCAITGMSNVTGYLPPLEKISALCRKNNIIFVIDAAQLASHAPVDLGNLSCDFFATSVHKMYGPTGVGILLAKTSLLEDMPPRLYGGGMIDHVGYERSTWATIPERFEGGTPNIAGVIGTKYALEFLMSINRESAKKHEVDILSCLRSALANIDGIRLIGPDQDTCSVCSFLVESVHAHDLGTLVDHSGVAMRTGHHCAQLLMRHFNAHSTSRLSFGVYNTFEEVDIAVKAIRDSLEFLR